MINTGKIDEIYNKITKSSIENISENPLGLSDCVIPFSKLFKDYKSIDIYSGTSKIPFKSFKIQSLDIGQFKSKIIFKLISKFILVFYS